MSSDRWADLRAAIAETPHLRGEWRCWNGWGPVAGTDLMAMTRLGTVDHGLLGSTDGRSGDLYAARADAEFAALACEAAPGLLAERDEATSEVERLKRACGEQTEMVRRWRNRASRNRHRAKKAAAERDEAVARADRLAVLLDDTARRLRTSHEYRRAVAPCPSPCDVEVLLVEVAAALAGDGQETTG